MPNATTLTEAEEQTLAAMCRRHWIDDMASAFEALPVEGTRLRIHAGQPPFPNQQRYTQHRHNKGGNENHFQGFQRLLSHHFVISGSDWWTPCSHLFMGRVASRVGLPTLGSAALEAHPPVGDALIGKVDLDETMWHAGGFSLCGHILAVPVECGPNWTFGVRGVDPPPCDPERSAIYFIDVRAPAAPNRLSVSVIRDGRKATAAALLQVPDTGYLLAVLSADEGGGSFRDQRIEFRWSGDAHLCTGFSAPIVYRIPKSLSWDNYQTINLVRETGGRVFLFAMTGKNVDLFELSMPSTGQPWVPQLTWINGREFELQDYFAAFDAGAGIWTRDGRLGLYSVPHWRGWDGLLGITEWMAPQFG